MATSCSVCLYALGPESIRFKIERDSRSLWSQKIMQIIVELFSRQIYTLYFLRKNSYQNFSSLKHTEIMLKANEACCHNGNAFISLKFCSISSKYKHVQAQHLDAIFVLSIINSEIDRALSMTSCKLNSPYLERETATERAAVADGDIGRNNDRRANVEVASEFQFVLDF